MSSKKVDWNEIRKTLSEKPDTWKCKQMCKFLKLHNLQDLVPSFKDNCIDGNLFLSLSDDDDLWDDLELASHQENLLKIYRGQLKEYDKKFYEYGKKSNNSNNSNNSSIAMQMKTGLEGITKKKINIEASEIYYDNSNPKKFEEKKVTKITKSSSSDEEEESIPIPIKRKIKKVYEETKEEDDEEDQTVSYKKGNLMNETKIIKLTLVEPYNKLTEKEFDKSFQINRQKELKEGFFLNNKEISRSHIKVHYLKNIGVFLQDEGSQNHTYIKCEENSGVVLRERMQFVMGKTIFEVIKLETNKITLSFLVNFEEEEDTKKEKLEIKFNKDFDDICFGSRPGNHWKQRVEFKKDEKIDSEHIVLKKHSKMFLLSALPSMHKTYVKLGEYKTPSDLYLLHKSMKFKLGGFQEESYFEVKSTFKQAIPLCTCASKKPSNSVLFPCLHVLACYDCQIIKEMTKCSTCKKKVEEIRQLIDLYGSY